MKSQIAKSFGKVILSGEHAAFYGQPAVAVSVDLYLDVAVEVGKQHNSEFVSNILRLFQDMYGHDVQNFAVKITGNIPIGSGLGSSAAIAHALLQALCHLFDITLDDDQKIAFIQASEKFAHGRPSGLDAVTVVKKGAIKFQRQAEKITYAPLPAKLLQQVPFFLLQSGRPKESTKKMIEIVQKKHQTAAGQDAITNIGKVTSQLIRDLENNQLHLEWMMANERYLEELGVVSEKAQHYIRAIEHEGGMAKMTGAGGFEDGAGMLLVYHRDTEKLQKFFLTKKWQYEAVNLARV